MTPLTRFGLALAVVGSALPNLSAQDAFKAALPDSTVAYFAAPDLPSAYQQFKQSALYKIWEEEEVQEFVEDLLAEGQKYWQMGLARAKAMHEQGMPISPDDLLKIRLKGISAAITDLSLQGKAGPRVSIVLAIDFGDTAPIANKVFEVLLAMGMQQPGAPEVQATKVGGATLRTIREEDWPPFLSFNLAFAGSRLLIGTDTARMKSIIGTLVSGDKVAGMTMNDQYKAVAKRLDASDSVLEMYVRPKAFVDVGLQGLAMAAQMGQLPPEVDIEGIAKAVDALGLTSMHAMGMVSGYDHGKGYIRGYMLCPENERKGFTAIGSNATINLDHLAYVPKDVDSFSIANYELKPVYSAIVNAVKAYNKDMADMLLAQLGEIEKQVGLSVQNDVFGAFGPECIYYAMPVSGLMGTPEMGVLVGCKDPAKGLRVIKTLAGLSKGIVEIVDDKDEDGTVFHSIDVDFTDIAPGFDMSMLGGEPTFTFKDGFMVFSMSRADCRSILKRLSGDGGPDVRTNAAFKPYVATLPKTMNSLSFTDVAASVEGLYQVVSGVFGMFPVPPEIPIDVGLLPSTDTITKHLFGSISYSTADANGFYSNMVSPFGPETFVFVGGAIVGGASALALVAERRGAPMVRRVGPGKRIK